MKHPLVSCVCPTADRRRFIPQMLACYEAQTWPHRELVVLDDGDDPVEDLLPTHRPGVHYFRVGDGACLDVGGAVRGIPAMRNAVNALARGEYIAHFDDDDWSAPHRLEVQMEAARRHRATLIGCRNLLFWDEATRAAYVYERGDAYACGTTMLYKRSLWQAHRFDESAPIGSDNRFLWSVLRAGTLHSLTRYDLMVARSHAGNTGTKPVGEGKNYRAIRLDELPTEFRRLEGL